MITITERLRNMDKTILPPEGAWVVIRGNTKFGVPRGLRIPPSIRAEGVKHFDIYWGYDEECPWKPYSTLKNTEEEDLSDEICFIKGITDFQLTWLTLHTPSSKLIRMWAGEVSVLTQGLINDMLGEDYVETMDFSKVTKQPIWDDLTRDMVGSLMLDGLSLHQAQDMLITNRAMKKKDHKLELPSHFYRPIGGFREMFSEEPEYEDWLKDRTGGVV